jgi:hypothetical protein
MLGVCGPLALCGMIAAHSGENQRDARQTELSIIYSMAEYETTEEVCNLLDEVSSLAAGALLVQRTIWYTVRVGV